MKKAIKEKARTKQQNNCDLSGVKLPKETKLYDTHRPDPKRKGGTYTKNNTKVVLPKAHQIEHGTLRERESELNTLKELSDSREQMIKLKNKIQNQLLAYKRQTDTIDNETLVFLEEQLKVIKKPLNLLTKRVENHVKLMAENNPLIKASMGVRGVGIITISYCLAYIDFEKARHASSLWAYVGLDKPSHSRYEKGTSGGGNKRLRCVLYTMAESQMKLQGEYRYIYDRTKERLSKSENIVKSRNTQGKMIECMWKDTKPSHRHGAALRAVMKHFLADYWMVGRTLAGLETSALYPEAILGGSHRTIMPEERGWKY